MFMPDIASLPPSLPTRTNEPAQNNADGPLWGGARPGDTGSKQIGSDVYTWRQESDGVWVDRGASSVFLRGGVVDMGSQTVNGQSLDALFNDSTTPEPLW
jgi:hypothetical protein